MAPFVRGLGRAGLALFTLLVVLAGVTAMRLRREGVPLAAFASVPSGPTRHVDLAKPNDNLSVVALSAEELAGRGIAKHTLGDLDVPSGAIVVADPLVSPERPALARMVPPGRYPVVLYEAQKRIALAELRLASGTPVRWQMALIPGQDAGTLKEDEIFGYPVDAGLGCFMDVEGQKALLAREAREKQRAGKDQFNAYDDLLAAPLDAKGGDELLFKPLDESTANVAIFHSGWGDGFYVSYWGLDEAGTPLVLVTDFDVLEDGEGRTPQMRWSQGELAAMTPDQRRDSAAGYAALRSDDLVGLEALLKQGRITPQTAIEATSVPFTYMTIANDKPGALDILVRYGADRTVPPGLGTEWTTYADLARSYARTKPDGRPEYDWRKPRSPELMAVISRWDATPPNPH